MPQIKAESRPQNAVVGSNSTGNLSVKPPSTGASEESGNITPISNAIESTPATSTEVSAVDQKQVEKLPDEVKREGSQRPWNLRIYNPSQFHRKTKKKSRKRKKIRTKIKDEKR